MYGYQSSSRKGVWAAVLGVLFAFGLVGMVFFLAARSELSDPSRAKAKASKLQAEADAIRAQTAYEQRQRWFEQQQVEQQAAYEQRQRELTVQQAEREAEYEKQQYKLELQQAEQRAAYDQQQGEVQLQLARQKAAAELQAFEQRQEIKSKSLEIVAVAGPIAGSMGLVTLVIAISYYLIKKARALDKRYAAETVAQSGQVALPSASELAQSNVSEHGEITLAIPKPKVSAFHVSYEGFLAYCVDYVLPSARIGFSVDCTRSDGQRQYYPAGISPEVEQAYRTILHRARGVTRRTNGGSSWILHPQIRNLDDIRRRFPRQAFEEITDECREPDPDDLSVLFQGEDRGAGEPMSPVQREPEYALG